MNSSIEAYQVLSLYSRFVFEYLNQIQPVSAKKDPSLLQFSSYNFLMFIYLFIYFQFVYR